VNLAEHLGSNASRPLRQPPRAGGQFAVGVEKLSPALDEPKLFSRFMREFGSGDQATFTDVIGNVLAIDHNLFLNLKGEWKIMKGERAPWLP
jgi:hypothetical protein